MLRRGRVIALKQHVAGMKNHATPWEKQLADLDINFVFEGRAWFLWVFGLCFRSANLGFA